MAQTTATAELLYFEDCPNRQGAQELLELVAEQEAVTLDLRLTEVASPEEAQTHRFLGSPSIRINGHDVEPGADERTTFMVACRVYRTEKGFSSQPAAAWIRAALTSNS